MKQNVFVAFEDSRFVESFGGDITAGDILNILAGLACDVVYTFPIELAYQGLKLGSQAGGEAQELGIIPLRASDGTPDARRRAALVAMLDRRAAHCGASPTSLITDDDLHTLCTVSGGHIRTLFELIQAAINRIGPDATQVTGAAVRHAIIRRADTMQEGLLQVHREVLDQVRATHRPPDDGVRTQFTELLFSQHVLAFYDELGTYDDAEQLLRTALPIYQTIGDRHGLANTTLSLGRTAHGRGEFAVAHELLIDASVRYRELGIGRWAEIAANEAQAVRPTPDGPPTD